MADNVRRFVDPVPDVFEGRDDRPDACCATCPGPAWHPPGPVT
ncbi:hypothetical protein ACFWBV_14380 [Streptomyces sp. NPDC060030]